MLTHNEQVKTGRAWVETRAKEIAVELHQSVSTSWVTPKRGWGHCLKVVRVGMDATAITFELSDIQDLQRTLETRDKITHVLRTALKRHPTSPPTGVLMKDN
jgi:hypothetical protein